MTYRRKLRGTHELVMAGFAHFNRGLPLNEWQNARVRHEEVESLVHAVLETGRRRGRAELALELGRFLGLDRALELELVLPPLTVAPLMREAAAPAFVPRELAGQVVIPPDINVRRRSRKP